MTDSTKKMSKADLLAALTSDDFDRDALVEALQAEAPAEVFRNRPEVRVAIDHFNETRQKGFQPAIYNKDPERLTVALKSMVAAIEDVAVQAGITLHPEAEVTESE